MAERNVTHGTFVVERIYPHQPEKVFSGFTDKSKKRRWMGGDEDGFTVEAFDFNFKVGEKEHWAFRFKGGPLMTNETTYHDIVPNERIVYAYSMTSEGKPFSSSNTTIELIPHPEGTKLILTEQVAHLDGFDNAESREEGTRALLEELAKELAK